MSQTIHIIATGGTIDSKFYPPTESSKVKENSGIKDFLDLTINPHFSFFVEELCMLDSSKINNTILDDLIKSIEKSECDKILITHGTNTMTETLSYLNQNIPQISKAIILTGSMIPLEGFTPTDAGFNLGYAIAQLQNLKEGIYICMNGKIFETGNVLKNFEIARFEEKPAS